MTLSRILMPNCRPILHHKKLSNWFHNRNEMALKYYALQKLIKVLHFLNNMIVLYGVPLAARAIHIWVNWPKGKTERNFQLNNHLEIFQSLKLLESFTWAVGSFFFFFLKCLEAAFNALVQACNEQCEINCTQ